MNGPMTELVERLEGVLPDDIKALPACLWAITDGRKMPHHPIRGSQCKANSARSYGTHSQAIDRLTRGLQLHGEADYRGYGVYLGEMEAPSGIVCADIDWKNYTGELNADGLPPIAAELAQRLDSYTEISQSGKGLHVFMRGRITRDRRFKVTLAEGVDLEVYAESRFIAVTGDVIYNSELEDRQEGLDWLLHTYLGGGAARVSDDEARIARGTLSEVVLIGGAAQAVEHACRTDAVFNSLYTTGRAPDGVTIGDGSGSSRDYRFLTKLVWYGLDFPTIDQIYRQSALYRPKWDRERFRDDESHDIIPGSYAATSLNKAWLAQMARGDDGELLRDAAGQMIPLRYSGRALNITTTVDTDTVRSSWAAHRGLLIDGIGTMRGSAAGRHSMRVLMDGLLDLIAAGQFESTENGMVRLITGGLDGLTALIPGAARDISDRLRYAAGQGLIGVVLPGERRGQAGQILMPADATQLLAIREGLHSAEPIPRSRSALKAAEKKAEQLAAGIVPEPRPVATRSAPRPPTLMRARYIAEQAFSRHTTSTAELAQLAREPISTARRCVRMMVDRDYLLPLPGRRLMATAGAQERFGNELAAEFDAARRAPAIRAWTRRLRYALSRLGETGEVDWQAKVERAEEALERLQQGESVRKVEAA